MAYVRNERLQDILTTAIEGGCAYWMNNEGDCIVLSVVYDKNYDITAITLKHSICKDRVWNEETVTANVLRNALVAMMVDMNLPQHLRTLAYNLSTNPHFDYDAGDADCVVQYTLFKEIVFG